MKFVGHPLQIGGKLPPRTSHQKCGPLTNNLTTLPRAPYSSFLKESEEFGLPQVGKKVSEFKLQLPASVNKLKLDEL